MKNGLNIGAFGTKQYYLNDELHREDGPAVEYTDGSKFWWYHGKQHREDGPAIEWVDGAKRWFLNGKLHRVDGPAEEWVDGSECWFLYGININHPEEFKTMEAWFIRLNADEEYSLPWIHDINGLIEVINNPTPKQIRLNAMKWKL